MTQLTERQIALLKRTFIDFRQTSEFIKNPLIIDRADGLYCWDSTGKKYFDAIGGIFVAVLGHRHPRLLAAMQAQMEKITFAPPLIAEKSDIDDLCERIEKSLSDALAMV